MKPTKLNLKNLKVESFVTSLEGKGSETVKAGAAAVKLRPNGICDSAAYCGNTRDGGNGCSQFVCTYGCAAMMMPV